MTADRFAEGHRPLTAKLLDLLYARLGAGGFTLTQHHNKEVNCKLNFRRGELEGIVVTGRV